MSNLASMIMEGAGYIGSGSLKRHYDHENGCGLIAMESAEALRDIFEAEFYIPNSNTIRATLEGTSYDAYSSIMEAKEGSVFQKIKDFFIKLKNKVMDFFHSVKRYLLGVFGDDVKWVNNYEKELRAIRSEQLKDYTFKMYNYKNLDNELKRTESIATLMENLVEKTKSNINRVASTVNKEIEINEDTIKEIYDKEFEKEVKSILPDGDVDDIPKSVWSHLRDGANDESNKEEFDIGTSQISTYIASIKNGPKTVNQLDKLLGSIKKAYDKAIKLIDDAEKDVSSAKISDGGYGEINRKSVGEDDYISEDPATKTKITLSTTNYSKKWLTEYAKQLRGMSAHYSNLQSLNNTLVTGIKTAYTERNSAYKKALVGAFGYARKHSK